MLLDRQVRLRIPSRWVPNSFCKLRRRGRLEFEFETRNWLPPHWYIGWWIGILVDTEPPLMRGGCIRRLTDWPIFVWIHLVYSSDLRSREGSRSNVTPLKDFCWYPPVLEVVRLSFIRYFWAGFVIIWTQIIKQCRSMGRGRGGGPPPPTPKKKKKKIG